MHEGGNPRFGKFELLNVAEIDGRLHYTFSGAGEVFSVVRPEMVKGMERQVREIVQDTAALLKHDHEPLMTVLYVIE